MSVFRQINSPCYNVNFDYYLYANLYNCWKERKPVLLYFLTSWLDENLFVYTFDKSKTTQDSFLSFKIIAKMRWPCSALTDRITSSQLISFRVIVQGKWKFMVDIVCKCTYVCDDTSLTYSFVYSKHVSAKIRSKVYKLCIGIHFYPIFLQGVFLDEKNR